MENLSLINAKQEGTGHQAEVPENLPMHPDDFAGLMSWITAKRFHETGAEKIYREKPVYFRIIGGRI